MTEQKCGYVYLPLFTPEELKPFNPDMLRAHEEKCRRIHERWDEYEKSNPYLTGKALLS